MAVLRIPLPIPPIHPKYRRLSVLALAVAGAFGFGLAVALLFAGGAARFAPPVVFTETFDGSPGAPQPWHPATWDVTVHSRDNTTWNTLEPMAASHGADCGAPPAEHQNSSYEGAVFLCKDHIMTAIQAGGYGLIYLTPPAMADFSQGESVIRWDMSTLRTSLRDWIDLWVVPYEDNLQLGLDESLPDGDGYPRRAVHVKMDNGNAGTIINLTMIDNYHEVGYFSFYQSGLEDEFAQRGVATSAARRDTFELRLRQGHVKLSLPQYGIVLSDHAVPTLTWTTGVVTFGHHSYNPEKDCTPSGTRTCKANTWHWDNVSISPAIPFTIIRSDRRVVDATQPAGLTLAAPAPQGASLRFVAIGNALEVSYTNGATWLPAVKHGEQPVAGDEKFKSYWMPIPTGTSRVLVRGQNWWGGPWTVHDLSVWAPGASAPGVTPTAVPTTAPAPTATTAALPTRTATPTMAATVVATGTPTVAPTRTATAVPPGATPTSVLSTPTAVPPGATVVATVPATVVAATATPAPAPGALCVRYLVTDGRLVDEQPAGCDPLRRS